MRFPSLLSISDIACRLANILFSLSSNITTSPLDEPPAVQICRLQTENDRLRSENHRFRTENCSPETEEEANHDRLRPENCYFPLVEAFLTEMEKVAEKEAEIRGETDANTKKEDADHDDEDQAVSSKKEEEDDEEEADRLLSENRLLKVENTRLKEAERAASTVQFQLEIENASLRMEEGLGEKAIRERDDMREALELAMAQCESLLLELDEKKKSDEADEKFAQLVEARIARDKAVEKMEDCMVYNKYLEERFRRHERAVQVVRGRALRMLERVKDQLADDCDAGEANYKRPESEEEVDEKWIGVLMRPLEEEMEKIESSLSKKR